MTEPAFIIDAARTPLGKGKPGGMLSHLHPTDLLADLMTRLIARVGIDPGLVEDVIVGCVSQVGEQSRNIARNALLAAGFPEAVPGTTVDRMCGSSQQALHFAAQGVMAGAYDLVLVAGVEMMSTVPMRSAMIGRDPLGVRLAARYPDGLVHQGISAELIAARWGIRRDQLDSFALESHRRAEAASVTGGFHSEIIPVGTEGRDEGIRPATTMEQLAKLAPAFPDRQAELRFPEIRWSVTAGNSSQVSDGAAAVLVASERAVRHLGLEPRARFRSFAVCGDDPITMLTGTIPSTRQVLARASLDLEDIDAFEVNEAFASVVLAWMKDLGVDQERVNRHGGAIALGHPLGASGARLMTTLLNVLERNDGRLGLQTMCESGGMANATVIERL